MPKVANLQGLADWMSVQTWPDAKALLQREKMTTYCHPYGFVVCRLESLEFPGWQIRVHIWPSAHEFDDILRRNETIDQQVHCHGWRLKSTVLAGALEEISCSVMNRPDDSGLRLYAVTSDYGSGYSRLKAVREGIEVHEIDRKIRTTADGLLDIPAGAFHMSRPASSGRAATLVATERINRTPTYVVAPPLDAPNLVNRRAPVQNLEETFDELDRTYQREAGGADGWASFVFLVNRNNEVLMVRSHRRPDLWQPVGGRAEASDRNPLRTAVRETFEELSFQVRPDELCPLASARRDVGVGRVHFWWTRVRNGDYRDVAKSEVREVRWVSLDDLDLLPTYPATGEILNELREAIAEG